VLRARHRGQQLQSRPPAAAAENFGASLSAAAVSRADFIRRPRARTSGKVRYTLRVLH
jgi:hypothetical protein